MNIKRLLALPAAAAIILPAAFWGCNKPPKPKTDAGAIKTAPIGACTEVVGFAPIQVGGYGLVAGLPGTGSSECPPAVRAYLKQYILTQLPKNSPITADDLINSLDTAVVTIEGTVPAGVARGERFDLRVSALRGTQTTSLAGGRLYTSELMLTMASKPIAAAQGPIYISPDSNDRRTGYILGGGRADNSSTINFALMGASFKLASAIRNRINERFGDDTANAVSESMVQIEIPAAFTDRKQKFISLVKSLYIGETKEQESARAMQLLVDLGVENRAFGAEIALEAIGKTEEDKIASGLKSHNPSVRFRAARCLLEMDNHAGLAILRENALKTDSPFRIEAIEAIAADAKRGDARSILRPLLADTDLKVRVKAYEALRKLEDPIITPAVINSGDIELDQIHSTGPALIYAYRIGQPRIAIFSAPLSTVPDVFVESANGSIIVNSDAEKKHLTVIRKLTKSNTVLGPVKSSFDVGDLIVKLSEQLPKPKQAVPQFGLAVPYSDTVALLDTMTRTGQIKAAFAAGVLPTFKTAANVVPAIPKDKAK